MRAVRAVAPVCEDQAQNDDNSCGREENCGGEQRTGSRGSCTCPPLCLTLPSGAACCRYRCIFGGVSKIGHLLCSSGSETLNLFQTSYLQHTYPRNPGCPSYLNTHQTQNTRRYQFLTLSGVFTYDYEVLQGDFSLKFINVRNPVQTVCHRILAGETHRIKKKNLRLVLW